MTLRVGRINRFEGWTTEDLVSLQWLPASIDVLCSPIVLRIPVDLVAGAQL